MKEHVYAVSKKRYSLLLWMQCVYVGKINKTNMIFVCNKKIAYILDMKWKYKWAIKSHS